MDSALIRVERLTELVLEVVIAEGVEPYRLGVVVSRLLPARDGDKVEVLDDHGS